MSRAEHDPLFDGIRVPDPDPALRARTLAAAAPVAAGAPAETSLVDRLWTSRVLRAAWVTGVLVMLAGHGLLAAGGPTLGTTAAVAAVAAEERERDEVTGWGTYRRLDAMLARRAVWPPLTDLLDFDTLMTASDGGTS